jgi:predicted  nucleic acid-binding Zn-ribbon protein
MIFIYRKKPQTKTEAPVSTDEECNCTMCRFYSQFEKPKEDKPEGLVNKQDILDSVNERLEEIKNEFTGYMFTNECIPDALNIEYNTLVENGRQLVDELNRENDAKKFKEDQAKAKTEAINSKTLKLRVLTLLAERKREVGIRLADVEGLSVVQDELQMLFNEIYNW